MGGVAGHLSHLYDNRGLTFNKMKKILSLASGGELIGTEKTDGFNIFLGFKDGVPRAARNKGDMKKGGMTPEELAAREFAGGPGVKKVYNDAFRAFEKAVLSLSEEERDAIFGPNGEIFYNTEIQGPGASNVVNYDANVISIHAGGHRSYDPETNKVIVVDATENSAMLDKVIDRFEQATTDEDFSVRRTAFLNLKQLSDDYDLKIVLAKLNKAGFSGTMTIENFLEEKLRLEVDKLFSYLSETARQDIIDKILAKEEAKNLVQIYKGFPPEEKNKLRAFVKQGPSLIGNIMWPIEEAIHDFAVELLKGLDSAYVLDNQAEVERLRKETAQAINNIRAYEGPGAAEAHRVLAQQLKKIKHLDNINTTVEGFVFQFEDQLYKFTGNFAPVNQLLGLFKYGRGTVPPIKQAELQEQGGDEFSEDIVQRKIAVIPGKFKPPHRGHLEMVEHYAEVADVVVILISPLSVETDGGLEISRDESKQIWEIYIRSSDTIDPSKIVIARSPFNSPVQSSYELVSGGVNEFQPAPGDLVIPAASTKPDPKSGCADTERFARFHEIPKENRLPGVLTAHVEDYAFVPQGHEVGCSLSARNFRAALDEADFAAIEQYIPDGVSADTILDIIHDGDIPQKKTLSLESLYSLVDEILEEGWKAHSQSCTNSEGKKGSAVVKKSETGEVESCHSSLEKAKSAVKARYVNYNEDKKPGFGEGIPPEGEWYKKQVIELEEAGITPQQYSKAMQTVPGHLKHRKPLQKFIKELLGISNNILKFLKTFKWNVVSETSKGAIAVLSEFHEILVDAIKGGLDPNLEKANLVNQHEKWSEIHPWYPSYIDPINEYEKLIDVLEILSGFTRSGGISSKFEDQVEQLTAIHSGEMGLGEKSWDTLGSFYGVLPEGDDKLFEEWFIKQFVPKAIGGQRAKEYKRLEKEFNDNIEKYKKAYERAEAAGEPFLYRDPKAVEKRRSKAREDAKKWAAYVASLPPKYRQDRTADQYRAGAMQAAEYLEEMSGMSAVGGGIEGYAGPVKPAKNKRKSKKRKRKNEQLFTEEETEQIVEELYNMIMKGAN